MIFDDDVDLNKIFHLNLSYNFDLLKNVLEKIMKKQKESDEKIKSLMGSLNEQKSINERILK